MYNLARPLKTLRIEVHDVSGQRWLPRTPAMAADLTDHIWSVKDNRCKTNLQVGHTTRWTKSPSPIEFPGRGSIRQGDGESDTAFSSAFRLSARPDALA